jgi:SAM-dependent methyltransferase
MTAHAVACPLCAQPAQLRYAGVRDLEYFIAATNEFYRCVQCGFVFMHPLPRRDELPRFYPPTYHNFERPAGRLSRFLVDRYYAHHAATCARYLPAGGSLLEVGAAGGDLLERLRACGYHVRGVEISADGCVRAREKGLDVFHGTLEEFPADERYDMVFMSHVIEHVIDPMTTMARVAALLKPGGVAYVETPNVGAPDARLWGRHWGLIHYPRHLFLFDRATLRRLFEGVGLAVVRMWSEFNSCGWALSIQCALRRLGIDRSRRPRSFYYPAVLLACLPVNLLDLGFGGTAFMAAVGRKASA